MSGTPASATLNNISVPPFHIFQIGVISDESHFTLGLSDSTKLRNDSAKDFPNVVISFKLFVLRRLKRRLIRPRKRK
jgi:hypothetical protein